MSNLKNNQKVVRLHYLICIIQIMFLTTIFFMKFVISNRLQFVSNLSLFVSMHDFTRFTKADDFSLKKSSFLLTFSTMSTMFAGFSTCTQLGSHKLLWITMRCHNWTQEPKTIDPDWLYWSVQVHTNHLETNKRRLQWEIDTLWGKYGKNYFPVSLEMSLTSCDLLALFVLVEASTIGQN